MPDSKAREKSESGLKVPEPSCNAVIALTREGRVAAWNTGAQELYGYTADEVLGSFFYELLPQGKQTGFLERLRMIRDGGSHDEVIEARASKEGGIIHVASGISLQKDEHGQASAFMLIERPVSYPESCGGAAGLNEQAFRLLVEGVRDYGIFMMDSEGKILSWNEGAQRIKGYKAEDVIGKHHSIFCIPEDIESGQCEEELRAAEKHGSVTIEAWRRHRDGSRFWARIITTAIREKSGKLCGFSKVVYDMTAHKAAEEALKRSEKHFRSLIENSLDLITVVDGDGTIVFQSHSVQRFLGYRPEEVAGRSLFDFIHPGDLAGALDSFSMTLKKAPSGRAMECRLRHKDGSWHIVEAKALNLLDDPNIAGIIINARDITDRKRLEEQLLKIGEREASRVGQDLHESLSQQLVGLEFMIRVLEQKLKVKNLSEESRDVAKIAGYLSAAITHTRDLARGLYPIGMELDSFTDVLAGLAADIEKQFHIKCDFECDSQVRLGDEEIAMHVYQIVRQALMNSAKRGDASHIAVGFKKVNNKIVLSVRDNGGGISREYLEQRGIGLHIMDHRAKMINGSLDIQPNASGGVTVICSFPYTTRIKGEGKK